MACHRFYYKTVDLKFWCHNSSGRLGTAQRQVPGIWNSRDYLPVQLV